MTKPQKQMTYTAVEHFNIHGLITEVNAKISQGWTPLGGIQVAALASGSKIFVQSLTKK